jgi:hypothetical protein
VLVPQSSALTGRLRSIFIYFRQPPRHDGGIGYFLLLLAIRREASLARMRRPKLKA